MFSLNKIMFFKVRVLLSLKCNENQKTPTVTVDGD